jgi:hypothetical protein
MADNITDEVKHTCGQTGKTLHHSSKGGDNVQNSAV